MSQLLESQGKEGRQGVVMTAKYKWEGTLQPVEDPTTLKANWDG